MKKNRIIFFSVIYDEMEEFIKEFIHSIKKQTFKNFTILLIDDTSNKEIKKKIINELNDFKIITLDGKGKGKINRIIGLKYIKKYKANYDIIVFGDSDDYMHKNRIKHAKHFFSHNKEKLFCSNLLFKKNSLFQTDMFFKKTISVIDLLEFNSVGLGCLSIKISLIDNLIKIIGECKTTILDWFLITILLIENKSKIYVIKKSMVYYRLHSNNLIGNPYTNLTNDKLKLMYQIKILHYKNIIDYLIKKNVKLKIVAEIKKKLILSQKNLFCLNDKKNNKILRKLKNILNKKKKIYWFQAAVSDQSLC